MPSPSPNTAPAPRPDTPSPAQPSEDGAPRAQGPEREPHPLDDGPFLGAWDGPWA